VPTKKITLELEMDSDYESSIYAAVGDLLAEIEDGLFTISNVKVEDRLVLSLGSVPTPTQPLAKALNKKYRYLSDYDGQ
jgi:hypothetical protein